ncbi:hypothetical protein Pelo_9933 [Pelomyxa schiedti]|nr:hypothetical protein Pelo_9933 [Pelomyxa schiedti]
MILSLSAFRPVVEMTPRDHNHIIIKVISRSYVEVMGWELRLFFELRSTAEAEDLNVFRMVGARETGGIERRTDDYIVLDECFGLKFRDSSSLELKERLEVDGRYHAEKWKKSYLHGTLHDPIPLSDLQYSLSRCPVSNPTRLQAVASRLPASVPLVKVAKQRKSFSAPLRAFSPTASGGSVSAEQTDIDVSIQGTSLGRYRSICVEGGLPLSLDTVCEYLQARSITFMMAGYPEFLFRTAGGGH